MSIVSPDLNPEIRAQLRDRLVTAIREAGRQQVQNDETRRQAEANRAIADEAQRLATSSRKSGNVSSN